MRATLGASAAVIMNTPEAARRVRDRFPELESGRIHAIPNGFDATDFEEPREERHDGVFRIVHTGYLYTQLGLIHRRTSWLRRFTGGLPVPGLDLLPRYHV